MSCTQEAPELVKIVSKYSYLFLQIPLPSPGGRQQHQVIITSDWLTVLILSPQYSHHTCRRGRGPVRPADSSVGLRTPEGRHTRVPSLRSTHHSAVQCSVCQPTKGGVSYPGPALHFSYSNRYYKNWDIHSDNLWCCVDISTFYRNFYIYWLLKSFKSSSR